MRAAPAVDDKVDRGAETEQEVVEAGQALHPDGGHEHTTTSGGEGSELPSIYCISIILKLSIYYCIK